MPRRNKQPPVQESAPESAEQPLPELDMSDFAPARAAKELRRWPIAPRPRQGDPAASFASRDIRITSDGRTWQVEARRELTGDEKDKLALSGFQAVDEDEKIWNASQWELAARGTDINVVAMALGKRGLDQGRGR